MKRKERLPELLCPAGSFECLIAAVEAGADAVYLGGKRFGARAYAKNFDTDELKRAVSYCHLHGVKLYVTLNTLVYDKELEDAVRYAAELYEMGVDALIIADIGAVREIRKYVPNLPLHASTQMSLHNASGVKVAEELGCERAVVARELSLSDIKKVTEESGIEIEVFLHGALCVCHSGQCLFSSMVGGRSGNRGECAQPCRLPYNGKYPLSLKDLSLAEHIPELIESGVSSLKIEGRMKSPDYVYTVTKIYRRLLDENRVASEKEKEELRRVFSRDGFTDGYFTGKIKGKMTGMRSENERSADSPREFSLKKKAVSAECVMRLGEPARLILYDGERRVEVLGAVLKVAESSPLTESGVKERLSKMGNTLLSLSADDIILTLDEGVNLSPSEINSLRREAAAGLEDFTREHIEFNYERVAYEPKRNLPDTALFLREEVFCQLPEQLPVRVAMSFLPLFSSDGAIRKSGAVYLPPIIFECERERVEKRICEVVSLGAKYALVGNLGALSLAKNAGLIPIGDFRLNVTNCAAAKTLSELGIEHFVLSPELTLPMARDIGGGLFSYGRVPLMITERCFMEENFGCKNCGKCSLTDRYSEKFPMMREFEHRNLILNSKITYVGDRRDELKKYRIGSAHFIFTTENSTEALSAMRAFSKGESIGGEVRRVGKRKNNKR